MFMEQFKRAQVIMLPTKDNHSQLEIDDLSINKLSWELKQYCHKHPQHLYIISDDEIKVGDWFIGDNISIKQCTLNNGGNINFKGGWYSGSTNCKKIIATTDTSLKTDNPNYDIGKLAYITLPQPSQQFIEKFIEEYNKGNIITDVLVEYETLKTTANNKHFGEGHIYSITNKLKINPKDNTIAIKKLKDSWNREEVNNLIKLFANNYRYASNDIGYNKWIEENL